MGNGRRLRRGFGRREVIHPWRGPKCPHCGAGLEDGFELLDSCADFRHRAAAHSVDVAVPGGVEALAWWFCHACLEGGAVAHVA